MKRVGICLVAFLIITALNVVPPSFSEGGILVAHGDHIELTCEDDESLSVTHTILETANITKKVNTNATYSIDGTLIGEITFENNSEIQELVISNKTENGITSISVSFSATLAPLKFTKFKLFYRLAGLLNNENGTMHLKCSFNTDSAAPPEIVVKIPKPSTFRKLIVKNTVPSPQVFIDENGYYDLVYKSPLFKFDNTSTTSIDINYETVWDSDAVFWWVILTIFSVFIAVVISVVIDLGKRIRQKFSLNREWQHVTFEIIRDKEGKFRFRLKKADGEIIATSEGFKTEQGCRKAIVLTKQNIANAELQNKT